MARQAAWAGGMVTPLRAIPSAGSTSRAQGSRPKRACSASSPRGRPGTAQVLPPKPLGRMARKLQEIASLPVESRPVDLYAALAEVAR